MPIGTQVEICNLALAALGRPTINLLTENTAEARACRQFYNHARRACLATSTWTFARRRTVGAASAYTLDRQWPHAFTRPVDAIAIVRVLLPDDPPRMGHEHRQFEVREGMVFTNLPPPVIIDYVSDLTDESRFSPLFVEYMAAHLATLLSQNLTRNPQQARELRQVALRARSEAVTADAAQDVQLYVYDENTTTADYSIERR